MAKDIPYKPVFPYTGKQIIIDSNRVTLNSKEDMTFLIAKKAVSISSGGTVNIDSEGMTIINSPKIKLGLNAEHPLVYGDTLVELLTTFFGFLQDNVAPGLSAASIEDSPVLTVQQAGQNLAAGVQRAQKELADVLSKTNFTD